MTKPLRVLLVEDSPDDAELVRFELIRGGFSPTLHRVETAAEMRAALQAGGWDVVLSDYQLPAFGAEAALETLLGSGIDLPFLILSGMVQVEEAIKLMKRGAHDFLDKRGLARLVPAIEREIREAADRKRRRAAEEQVRVLSMAVEQSPVAVVITDTDGTITYVNPRFCDTSGFGRSEVLGRTPAILKSGETSAEDYAGMWRAITGGSVWRGMFHNRRKDGSLYWDEASISPVRDPDGRISHFVGITQDVSERQDKDRELRRAVEYLSTVNAELERFAYVASHDLQEPLRTLISFTQLLGRRLEGRLGPETEEYMGYIVDAARHMHALINDLLGYSRLTAEERHFSRVPLAEACGQALRNLKCSIDEADAGVSVGDLPEVIGDATQLVQLFQNLIGNAVKFRRPGIPPRIAVEARRDGRNWRISVSDNGIGIAPSSQDIFEIFRRLHPHAEYPGTGIGLAVCKSIVQRHRGRIWVDSGAGEGSVFQFTLPAAE